MDENEHNGTQETTELETGQETAQEPQEQAAGGAEPESGESATQEGTAAQNGADGPEEASAAEPAEETAGAEPAAAIEAEPEQPTSAQEPASKKTESDSAVSIPETNLLGGGRSILGGINLLSVTASETTEEQELDEEYDTIPVGELNVVKLGRQGENETQEVKIDCSAWLEKLPGCDLLIAAVRPGETAIYLPTITAEEGVITWPILEQDTARAGWGRAEVRAMLDGKIKKSAIFRTTIEPSLEGSAVTPTTPPDWVQAILDSVAAAETAARTAAAQATAAAESAAAAVAQAAQAATNTAGLRGWSLTMEENGTVTIDYTEET